MILSLRSMAQSYFPTTGRWMEFSIQNYSLTVSDLSEIVTNNKNGRDETTLPSGCKVKVLHPEEWLGLVLQSYQTIDNSITIENLVEAINASTATTWSSNMPFTKNYYWSKNGNVAFINDYTGTTFATPVIVYKGYPVIKRSCGNPVIIKTTPPISTLTNIIPNNNNNSTIKNDNNNVNVNGGRIVLDGRIDRIVGSGATVVSYNQTAPSYGEGYGYNQSYYYRNNYVNNSFWAGSGARTSNNNQSHHCGGGCHQRR